jgi:hypothetical protein
LPLALTLDMASATDVGVGGRASGGCLPGVGVATVAAAASALNTGLRGSREYTATVAAPRRLRWVNDGAEEDVEVDALSAGAMRELVTRTTN